MHGKTGNDFRPLDQNRMQNDFKITTRNSAYSFRMTTRLIASSLLPLNHASLIEKFKKKKFFFLNKEQLTQLAKNYAKWLIVLIIIQM